MYDGKARDNMRHGERFHLGDGPVGWNRDRVAHHASDVPLDPADFARVQIFVNDIEPAL